MLLSQRKIPSIFVVVFKFAKTFNNSWRISLHQLVLLLFIRGRLLPYAYNTWQIKIVRSLISDVVPPPA